MTLLRLFRMSRFLSSILLTLLFSYPLFAQIAIGQWRDHLPYSDGVQLADAGDYIFSASNFGLFQYHKQSGDVLRLSKVSGLSDIGYHALAWSEENNTLVIAYANTNLDLIQDGQIINVPDIKDKSILGNKTIHKVHIKDDYAYLACGFAIVVLDLVKHEIKDTYYLGSGGSALNIYDLTTTDDKIFAATEQGVFWAYLSGFNLADYQNWNLFASIPQDAYNTCTWFNDNLFVNLSVDNGKDTIYRWNGTDWFRFDDLIEDEIRYLETSEDVLMVTTQGASIEYFTDLTRGRLAFEYGPGTSANPSYCTIDDDNIIWISDRWSGLVKHFPGPSFAFERVGVNGPSAISSTQISIWDSRCYVAAGGIYSSGAPQFLKDGMYSYKDNSWKNISPYSFPETTFFQDYLGVIVDPFDSKRVYVTAYGTGVLEYYDDEFVAVYDTLNSTLDYVPGQGTRVLGLQIDRRNGTLWVSASGTSNNILAKDASGNWYAFDSPAIGTEALRDIAIDDIGQKWIVAPRGVGIVVFNDNGTLSNTNDDQSIKLTQNAGNGNLASNEVFCIAADLDGEIWVGTNKGISVFYSPESVFSGGDFDSQRILVEQDGYVQYLLENESVTAIAVDGANRKWIGTANAGVFLLSDDGTQEVYHFTTENSPLFSDQVTALGVDHLTGEVFIGTTKGMISFRGTATWGTPEFVNEDVYAYPNPVEPDYEGVIAVKGLVRDADVKITDAAGNVVYATIAEGGQAIWDGNRITGGRAQSGVYLVFASNEDGKETFVTKILFIN